MLKLAAITLTLLACGARPSPSQGSPRPAASTFATQVASLPPGVVGLARHPTEWAADFAIGLDLGVENSCWRPIANARVDGLYFVKLARDDNDEGVPMLLHGDLTVDTITKCFEPDARKQSKDARVIVYEGGAVPRVMAQIAPGWIYVGRSAASVIALLDQPAKQPNALAEVAAGLTTTGEWKIGAYDVTTTVLGVPSRGVRFELVTQPDPKVTAGTGVVAILFADAAAAKAALEQFNTPNEQVSGTAFGLGLPDARERVAKIGTPAVVGRTVELRGLFTKTDIDDLTDNMFWGTGTPVN